MKMFHGSLIASSPLERACVHARACVWVNPHVSVCRYASERTYSKNCILYVRMHPHKEVLYVSIEFVSKPAVT